MKKVIEAEKAHEEIVRQAEENSVNSTRVVHRIDVGQIVRQGDVYIHRVEDGYPHGKKRKSRKLAIGVSAGSRHIAESPSEVYEGTDTPQWCGRGTFLGPLVESESRWVVSHPEHAHISLPGGSYQITHQMDARTLKRVQD